MYKRQAIDHIVDSANEFSEMAETPVPVPWEPKVITWHELFQEVAAGFDGNLAEHVETFINGIPDDADERDKSLYIVGELLRLYPDKHPMIVIGFLPPYYPHRANKRQSEREDVYKRQAPSSSTLSQRLSR